MQICTTAGVVPGLHFLGRNTRKSAWGAGSLGGGKPQSSPPQSGEGRLCSRWDPHDGAVLLNDRAKAVLTIGAVGRGFKLHLSGEHRAIGQAAQLQGPAGVAQDVAEGARQEEFLRPPGSGEGIGSCCVREGAGRNAAVQCAPRNLLPPFSRHRAGELAAKA